MSMPMNEVIGGVTTQDIQSSNTIRASKKLEGGPWLVQDVQCLQPTERDLPCLGMLQPPVLPMECRQLLQCDLPCGVEDYAAAAIEVAEHLFAASKSRSRHRAVEL